MELKLTLQEARKTIIKNITPPLTETVPLMEARGRVTARAYSAPHALPEYSQSLFDGYAIAPQKMHESKRSQEYTLVGEIAAGDTAVKRIASDTAYRIMTGAMVPMGTWKVIPQEKCEKEENRVVIKTSDVANQRSNICRKGTRLRKGSVLVPSGINISAPYLAKMAQFGIADVEVACRAKTAFFCTGSELVDTVGENKPGKKYSSNRYLLSGLISQCGGEIFDGGSVRDEKKALVRMLSQLSAREPAIIISTGGMGPGKYDLLEESFCRVGGKTVFSSLQMRPGKSLLFGLLGNSLYFGLPGPPFAVQTLFYALILPTIMAAQGYSRWRPEMKRAMIDNDFHVAGRDMLRLQEGVLFTENEKNMVRLARPNEIANCYLYCHAGRTNFRQGSLLSVQTVP